MDAILLKFGMRPEKELYSILMRATPEERDLYCQQGKFKAMCALLKYDRFLYNNSGDLALNKLGRSTFKIVLESFPDFTQGLALIEAIHPGFIYTDEFAAYVKDYLKITQENKEGIQETIYTLGAYKYIYSTRDGIKYSELWYKDGKEHRIGAPSYMTYFQDGNVQWETWSVNGVRHREDGPAIILHDKNGKITYSVWYIDGNKISEKLY